VPIPRRLVNLFKENEQRENDTLGNEGMLLPGFVSWSACCQPA